jgi:hypothetical protein
MAPLIFETLPRLDACGLDHLAPLFGIFDDKRAEIDWEPPSGAAQSSQFRMSSRIFASEEQCSPVPPAARWRDDLSDPTSCASTP